MLKNFFFMLLLISLEESVRAQDAVRGDYATGVWQGLNSLHVRSAGLTLLNKENEEFKAGVQAGQLQIQVFSNAEWNGNSDGARQRQIHDYGAQFPEIAGKRPRLALIQSGKTIAFDLKVTEMLALDLNDLSFEDVPSAVVGTTNVNALRSLCSLSHRNAISKKFVSGVPTGHEGRDGGVHVLGIHFIKESAIDRYMDVELAPIKADQETARRIGSVGRHDFDAGFSPGSLNSLKEWSEKFYKAQPCFVASAETSGTWAAGKLRVAFLKSDRASYVSVNEKTVIACGRTLDMTTHDAVKEWFVNYSKSQPLYGSLALPDGSRLPGGLEGNVRHVEFENKWKDKLAKPLDR